MGLRSRLWRFFKRRHSTKPTADPYYRETQSSQPHSNIDSIPSHDITAPSIQNKCRIVCAIYDFESTNADECSFIAGDLLKVLDNSTGEWWYAQNTRTEDVGVIPFNYVTTEMGISDVFDAWYDIDRLEAERKLLMLGVEPGTYILRSCKEKETPYALSVRIQNNQHADVKHFKVNHDVENQLYFLASAVRFTSLDEMLTYYTEQTIDGNTLLFEPRPRIVQPPMRFEDCLVDYGILETGKVLGKGNFGVVYEGRMKTVKVAIKESLQSSNDDFFLAEAKVMHKLCHPRLVRFLGFCTNSPNRKPLIITEFMANGSLTDYLQTPEGKGLKYILLIHLIDQVVKGMTYLESCQVNHRDLRCSNVLVAEDGGVKVADFGLTTITEYQAGNEGQLNFPVRWTAPEAMVRPYAPNIKADVWSFGVLMFEVLTYGSLPYKELSTEEIPVKVRNEDYRLKSPVEYKHKCDDRIYIMMMQCWAKNPECRPSFKNLSHAIEDYIATEEGCYIPNDFIED